MVLVLASLAACGGAVFFVLDRPVARSKRRNTSYSLILLTVSAIALLAVLGYAVIGWLTS